MNKYLIRVIKRGNNTSTRKIAVVLDSGKIERRDRRDAVGIVNDWISECRENRRIERIFSDNKISAWKALPPILTKTLV